VLSTRKPCPFNGYYYTSCYSRLVSAILEPRSIRQATSLSFAFFDGYGKKTPVQRLHGTPHVDTCCSRTRIDTLKVVPGAILALDQRRGRSSQEDAAASEDGLPYNWTKLSCSQVLSEQSGVRGAGKNTREPLEQSLTMVNCVSCARASVLSVIIGPRSRTDSQTLSTFFILSAYTLLLRTRTRTCHQTTPCRDVEYIGARDFDWGTCMLISLPSIAVP
jgi:hypothetical protein